MSIAEQVASVIEGARRTVADATVHVEWEDDLRRPGRRGYRLTGKRAEAIQLEINDLMNAVADKGGSADFVGPRWVAEEGVYRALGQVFLPVSP